jgi:hypothetical protein
MDHVLVEAFLGKRQAALLSPGKETIQRAKCLEASATAYSEIGRTTLPIHGLDRLLRIGNLFG